MSPQTNECTLLGLCSTIGCEGQGVRRKVRGKIIKVGEKGEVVKEVISMGVKGGGWVDDEGAMPS